MANQMDRCEEHFSQDRAQTGLFQVSNPHKPTFLQIWNQLPRNKLKKIFGMQTRDDLVGKIADECC